MLDCHCHLDRFKNPIEVAQAAVARGVFVVGMTNLPSHFELGLPFVRRLTGIRLGLGLHPLAVAGHRPEFDAFTRLLPLTSFVGEVGLDFSRHGRGTKAEQIDSFRFVARHLVQSPKVVSLHSRGAEADVLAILQEHRICGAIFHWFTGPLAILDRAIADGHYFSVNPAMLGTASGRAVIGRVPRTRLLTESDGPYAKVVNRPAHPWDVATVEDHVAHLWQVPTSEVSKQIWTNFGVLTRMTSDGQV